MGVNMTHIMMQEALAEAEKATLLGEVPVGAVLVHNKGIIARAHNFVETRKDPTAHAEMLVIQEGARVLGAVRLVDCDLYVTLEPCAMCAQAIAHARIRRLYFGAYDPKGGGVDHGAKIFSHKTCHHSPEIYGGILESKCSSMLTDFFKKKREPK